jgi:hypothetical protein
MAGDLRHPKCGLAYGSTRRLPSLWSLSRADTELPEPDERLTVGPVRSRLPRHFTPVTPNLGLNGCETRSPAQRSDSAFSTPL